ncbi:hypothetical protein JQ597_25525 [Bradyrhizobium sp. AUGA SZCCT0177]|uniref:hypothetical protein n=1 Tax=Bradyrhizobium sp. AUGA SZCCT0177 TaxID=2807665 RepID=UPI001BA868EB|nr:hypothetical protein [Bradyrhizobium sp. AUGA SZCCT0177]MBR1285415.1 hypothetical protein [Bradyrhizobium sp. AUGA SZCCT0177]
MDMIIVTAAAIAEMDLIVEPPQAHCAAWPETCSASQPSCRTIITATRLARADRVVQSSTSLGWHRTVIWLT